MRGITNAFDHVLEEGSLQNTTNPPLTPLDQLTETTGCGSAGEEKPISPLLATSSSEGDTGNKFTEDVVPTVDPSTANSVKGRNLHASFNTVTTVSTALASVCHDTADFPTASPLNRNSSLSDCSDQETDEMDGDDYSVDDSHTNSVKSDEANNWWYRRLIWDNNDDDNHHSNFSSCIEAQGYESKSCAHSVLVNSERPYLAAAALSGALGISMGQGAGPNKKETKDSGDDDDDDDDYDDDNDYYDDNDDTVAEPTYVGRAWTRLDSTVHSHTLANLSQDYLDDGNGNVDVSEGAEDMWTNSIVTGSTNKSGNEQVVSRYNPGYHPGLRFQVIPFKPRPKLTKAQRMAQRSAKSARQAKFELQVLMHEEKSAKWGNNTL
ncbi:hypothetical protein BGZ73_000200 [Actinomortierella ambigua]|nr:hypothetical protein BGZ73_000200 [Actinomortierella ambigua]